MEIETSSPLTSEDNGVSSPETCEPTIKKKQRMGGQKTCRVCGDRALAHNFDVISCESCKAFFRRNAVKTTKIKPCAFNGDCDVTPETRRFCCPCRLRKCLACGMKPDMIMDEQEKQARQSKVAENRRKKEAQQTTPPLPDVLMFSAWTASPPDTRTAHAYPSQDSFVALSFHSPPPTLPSPDCGVPTANTALSSQPDGQLERATRGLTLLDRNAREYPSQDSFVASSFDSPPTLLTPDWGVPTADTALSSQPEAGQLERATRGMTLLDRNALLLGPADHSAVAAEEATACDLDLWFDDVAFQHVRHEALPSDLRMYYLLSDEERALLAELTVAYQETLMKLPENPFAAATPASMASVHVKCRAYAHDVVSFVKRVVDFRSLRMEDQLASLQGSAWRTLLVKSSAGFVLESNGWLKNYGFVTADQLAQLSPQHEQRIRLMARFSSSMKQILRGDTTAFALLQVLMLFDPKDAGLQERQHVCHLSDKYALLLKHYLESVWSFCHAPHYLDAVRNRLQRIPRLGKEIELMYGSWKDMLEPVMREMFNLS